MDQKIQKALETWHGGDGLEARINMALSLIGEMGEVTNLYRKMFFKPGYILDREKALDELGDVWYYVRIFAFLDHQDNLDSIIENLSSYGSSILHRDAIINVLNNLHQSCLQVENWALLRHYYSTKDLLGNLILQLSFLLRQWECSLDELTELNYQKLTANQNHHGWKSEVNPMLLDDYKEKYLGFDHAKEGGDKTVIGIWKKEEDGKFTFMGKTPLTEEAVDELKKNFSEEEFKVWYEKKTDASPSLSETELLYEGSCIEHDEKEEDTFNEDWREQMQKRIRQNEERSREVRGRWY